MKEQWIFNAVFIIGFVVSTIIRVPFERNYKNNVIVSSLRTKGEMVFMYVLFCAMAGLPFLYIFTSWMQFFDYARPSWAGWLGVATMAGSIWIFRRSHIDLGKNWSVSLELHAEHQLIEHGIYARIRHPMYSSTYLWCLSQCLLFPNWLAGPTGIIFFSILYLSRVKKEEDLMLKQFGTAYSDYCARTGRLLPR